MGTIKALCLGAEKQANENAEELPGAEHFLLAALELPEGSARRVLERLGSQPDDLQAAIARQYRDALQGIGVDLTSWQAEQEDGKPIAPKLTPYRAQPSVQELMTRLTQVHDKSMPLLGVHVFVAAASMEYSVAARALRAMGIDKTALEEAMRYELGFESR